MQYKDTAEFATTLDQDDPLFHFRSRFYLPKDKGKDVIYLCGNSLGLQPKTTALYLEEELAAWRELAVEAHFRAKKPWLTYHALLKEPLATLAGAYPEEVVAMNNLTTNLHLMLVSFYRPSKTRFKIITEAGAFPSDMYALESQVKFHEHDPDQAIIELRPRAGEVTLRTEDIVKEIETHKDELALVMIGGVQYYTGQFFDLKAITEAAHKAGAYAGFDLAHAMGNVLLNLHSWEVDFAVWCSYKYLNGSPGGTGGAFVHENHGNDNTLPRFAGWWGYMEKERFRMLKGFKPMPGASGWQLSNAPILTMAPLRASLEIFEEAGIENLRTKSIKLTGYLHYLLQKINTDHRTINIITPVDPEQRGCQLSLLIPSFGRKVFEKITEAGIVADWREPDVIRVAPVPLYNSFTDIYNFSKVLKKAIEEVKV